MMTRMTFRYHNLKLLVQSKKNHVINRLLNMELAFIFFHFVYFVAT